MQGVGSCTPTHGWLGCTAAQPLRLYPCCLLQGPGASGFRWRKRDKLQRQSLGSGHSSGGGGSSDDSSLFVEPLRWMCEGGSGPAGDSVVGGAVQGKLYCPK